MDTKDDNVTEKDRDSLENIATDEVKPVSSRNLDETYEVYKQQDARELDSLEARRVLRKIDLHILPLLMGTYMLQYLDKSSINFAAVFGLEEGTNLSGQGKEDTLPDGGHY
jgi:hypothetical protein